MEVPFEWAPISLRRGRRGNFVATFLTGRKWEKFKLPRPIRQPAPAGAERGGGERKSESIEIGAAERTAGTRPRFTLHGRAVETAPRSRTEEGRHFGKGGGI